MYFLLSGEGSTDMGTGQEASPISEKDEFSFGPMAIIVARIVKPLEQESFLRDSCGFVSEKELGRQAKDLKPAKKSPRLRGKKRQQETLYFFENARTLACIAKQKATSGSGSGSHLVAKLDNVAYYEKEGLLRPNWEYNPKESALSQVPKMFHESEEFRKRLASSTDYHVLDVSRRAPIRLPQRLRDATLPGHDGEDLISSLYTLRETDPDRFELIEATLRAGFPDFERLNFPPVAVGTLAMTWKDKNSKHSFYREYNVVPNRLAQPA